MNNDLRQPDEREQVQSVTTASQPSPSVPRESDRCPKCDVRGWLDRLPGNYTHCRACKATFPDGKPEPSPVPAPPASPDQLHAALKKHCEASKRQNEWPDQLTKSLMRHCKQSSDMNKESLPDLPNHKVLLGDGVEKWLTEEERSKPWPYIIDRLIEILVEKQLVIRVLKESGVALVNRIEKLEKKLKKQTHE